MNSLASNLLRVAIAAIAIAFAMEIASSAVAELSNHIAAIVVLGLLAIGTRIVWKRSSL